MSALKESSDGVSKVWNVEKSHKPFYCGGKVLDLIGFVVISS